MNLWLYEYDTLRSMLIDAKAVAASEVNDEECKLIARHSAKNIQAEIDNRENAARKRGEY